MVDREKVLSGLECCADPDTECGDCPYFNHTYFYPDCKETMMQSVRELLKADQTYLKEQDKKVKKLENEISELRETLTEMSMNGGTGNQHDICKFLLNLMDVIESDRPVYWRAGDE